MELSRYRTGALLSSIAVVFVVVLIVICWTPTGNYFRYQKLAGSLENKNLPKQEKKVLFTEPTYWNDETVGYIQSIFPTTTTTNTVPPSTSGTSEHSPTYTTTNTFPPTTTGTSEHSTRSASQEVTNETCDDPDCKKMAARMLDMMDHGVTPCDDFYQFACGGVENDKFLDPDEPSVDVLDRLVKELKDTLNVDDISEHAKVFFQSCINKPSTTSENDIDILRDLVSKQGLLDPRVGALSELDGLYDFIDEDPFMLNQTILDFLKLDFAPFFDISLDVDKRNKNNFAVRISLPLGGFSSGFSESVDTAYCKGLYDEEVDKMVKNGGGTLNLTIEYDKLQECRSHGAGTGMMVASMQRAVRLLRLTDYINDTKLEENLIISTAVNTDFLFAEIKEYWPPMAEVRRALINKEYTEYRVEDLDQADILSTVVAWGPLLQAVVGQPVDAVQVYHEDAIRNIMKRVQEDEWSGMLRNTLLMMWANRLYTDLIEPVGPSNTPEYCIGVMKYLMPDIAGLMFLRSFPEDQLEEMNEKVHIVVENVKTTIIAALTADMRVDQDLINKMIYTVAEVGASTHLQDLTQAVHDTTFLLMSNGAYVDNSLQLLERRRRNMYQVIATPTDGHIALWHHFSVPHSISATYLYSSNIILLPEGIMTAPFYYPKLRALPDYLLYAGIGHIVAQEFLHAMDTTGMKFHPSSSSSTLTRPPNMDEREFCLKQSLKMMFSVEIGDSTHASFILPEELSLNELMADSGATRLAWLAYGKTAAAEPLMEFVTEPASKRKRQLSVEQTPSTSSNEKPLPWLGMTPYQLYLLRTAQSQCQRTSAVNLLDVMETEHLPARLRVNLNMVNEPLFAEAFGCSNYDQMSLRYTCPI